MCVPTYKNMGERLLQNVFPLHNHQQQKGWGVCILCDHLISSRNSKSLKIERKTLKAHKRDTQKWRNMYSNAKKFKKILSSTLAMEEVGNTLTF